MHQFVDIAGHFFKRSIQVVTCDPVNDGHANCIAEPEICLISRNTDLKVVGTHQPRTLPRRQESNPTLTVVRAGSGGGTVSSTPSGISCGTTCQATYTVGTSITLTAQPDALSDFAGFSGCAPTSATTCSLTLATATTVTATFARPVVPVITLSAPPSGTSEAAANVVFQVQLSAQTSRDVSVSYATTRRRRTLCGRRLE